MVPEGESLAFTEGKSFSYSLPEIIDEDDDPAKINLSILNEACPWLTLNIENRRIEVARDVTDSSNVGIYPFEIILSDNNIYGKAEVRYFNLI